MPPFSWHSRRFMRGALALCVAESIASSRTLADDFNWGSISGTGESFISDVKNQGSAGTCWAFSSTSTFEARIMITRNDPTWRPDLSEQNLICPGTMGDVVNGGYEYSCMDYFTSNGTVVD